MSLPELSQVKTRRKLLGLTQKQLAVRAGVSQSLIAKLEDGSVQPNYAIAKRLFEELAKLEGEKETLAAQLMTRKIQSCNANQTVKDACELMLQYDISQIPVMDGERVAGSLTERDIIEAQIREGRKVFNLPLAKIMGPSFPMVDASTPRSTVSSLLRHSQAVLVTEKGKLTGIISRADLLAS